MMIGSQTEQSSNFKLLNKIKVPFKIFAKGDWATRLSFLIMGFGCFVRKQFIKGLLYFLAQVLFVFLCVFFISKYLPDLGTLGTVPIKRVWDEVEQVYINIQVDNSMLILLYSIVSIFIIFFFCVLYINSLKAAYNAQINSENGKKNNSFFDDIKSLLDDKFHTTLLTLPSIGVILFTILPLIFMILIAFTNYDSDHLPPAKLFDWVGLANFKELLWGSAQISSTFGRVLLWTMIWAFFATFTNYFAGMFLAIIINKKGIKFKAFWRTMFVMTIAVPQFVTLLTIRNVFANIGLINTWLQKLNIIDRAIPFFEKGWLARIMIIIINMWVGIPYTLLIVSGILMNIPQSLYESAKIDGASPFKMFVKITFPYVFFVTAPYLLTQFVGNINNFNVIYYLTAGGPKSLNYFFAGETDLLITWLYSLTSDKSNYKTASVIGIMVFLICSVFSLIAYNLTSSTKREEDYQA
ncbi:MAG TPA: sugar ABC transporter permease [Clostridia bacterium]